MSRDVTCPRICSNSMGLIAKIKSDLAFLSFLIQFFAAVSTATFPSTTTGARISSLTYRSSSIALPTACSENHSCPSWAVQSSSSLPFSPNVSITRMYVYTARVINLKRRRAIFISQIPLYFRPNWAHNLLVQEQRFKGGENKRIQIDTWR